MSKIKKVTAKEIKDSRGNPTLEVCVETERGEFLAGVPSGASTGKNEALELRDVDGKGVALAIKNVNEIIAPKLKVKNPENQKEIDELMIALDGMENKSKLGANAIVGVSMAVCRAGAASKKIPLYEHITDLVNGSNGGNEPISKKIPLAMFNIIEGGAHAKNDLTIQEFMIVPQKKTFGENLILCNKIFNNLGEYIKKSFSNLDMGDEGGFAPMLGKTEQALSLLKNVIGSEKVNIALDCAASQFYKDGKYFLDGNEFSRAQLLEIYKDLASKFPIISIEDPFDEDDWLGFKDIIKVLPRIAIIGDDLTTTNIKKIKEAHSKNAINGVILKLNQIGTVWETVEAGVLAKSYGWKTIVSHRSGETMDNFIGDLAVGLGADFIKSGSPSKPERMVKYQRLLEIEKELKK